MAYLAVELSRPEVIPEVEHEELTDPWTRLPAPLDDNPDLDVRRRRGDGD
jgi:hypothetical protein